MSHNETILQAKIDKILLKQWDWVLEKMGKTRRGRLIEILEKDIQDYWSPALQVAFEEVYGSEENESKEQGIGRR